MMLPQMVYIFPVTIYLFFKSQYFYGIACHITLVFGGRRWACHDRSRSSSHKQPPIGRVGQPSSRQITVTCSPAPPDLGEDAGNFRFIEDYPEMTNTTARTVPLRLSGPRIFPEY
jgi:hypothetical protein